MARPKPLAEYIDACLGRALAAQGFAASDVIVAWPEIVGESLAGFSHPIRIDWPRRGAVRGRDERPEPAVLVVRVEGAFAIEMQHMAPLVVERVNAYYGWRCVGRLVLKQGPVRRTRPKQPAQRPLDADEKLAVSEAVDGVEEQGLRGALDRLGSAVLANAAERPLAARDPCHIPPEVLPQAPLRAEQAADLEHER